MSLAADVGEPRVPRGRPSAAWYFLVPLLVVAVILIVLALVAPSAVVARQPTTTQALWADIGLDAVLSPADLDTMIVR